MTQDLVLEFVLVLIACFAIAGSEDGEGRRRFTSPMPSLRVFAPSNTSRV